MRIAVRQLDPGLPLPAYARADDAGLDLFAAEDVTLPPGARAQIRTGLAVAIPPGHAGFVLPRSGRAAREGLSIVNAPGLIDSGYRGEIEVNAINHDPAIPIEITRGDRIAQLVIVKVEQAELEVVDGLPPSDRGAGGHGSTGR